MELQEKRDFFDILKGIAIFGVVIGHLVRKTMPFLLGFHNIFHTYVYSFHLAIFFFVSGFLYNKEKYQDEPSLNFVNRFKRCYVPFLIYCILLETFLFLIPSFFHPVIKRHRHPYDFDTFISNSIQYFLMIKTPNIASSLWFIVPFIISSSIFGIIIYLANKIKKIIILKNQNNIKKASIFQNAFIIFSSIAISLIGYYEILEKIRTDYRTEIAFFVLPLLTLGFYTNHYISNLKKFLNPIVAICAFITTMFLLYSFYPSHHINPNIDLKFYKFNYVQYFTLGILGIYQMMYLSKLLQSVKILGIFKKFFSYIGKYTFEIMTFHRCVFRSLSFLFISILSFFSISKINNEFANYAFLFLYIILACLIPAFIKNKIDAFLSSRK